MKILLRSPDYRVRLQVATWHRQQSIAHRDHLLELLLTISDPFTRKVLKSGIQASEAHANGWKDYINEGCPLEPRAQVTPRTYRRTFGRRYTMAGV